MSLSRIFLEELIEAAKGNEELAKVLKAELKDNPKLMQAFQDAVKYKPKPGGKQLPLAPHHKAKSYGGVVFNDQGQILLREPKNHWEGYVWTFAKGGRNPGEGAEEAALREVLEESGVRGEIVAPLPGKFSSFGSDTQYFLMRAVEDTGEFGKETESVRWVDPEEAKKLIGETKNKGGQKRDLAVLDAAVKAHQAQQEGTAVAPTPEKWEAFLKERFPPDGGKTKVKNTNPKTKDKYPEVEVDTLLKTDLVFRKRIKLEFHKWLEKQKA